MQGQSLPVIGTALSCYTMAVKRGGTLVAAVGMLGTHLEGQPNTSGAWKSIV